MEDLKFKDVAHLYIGCAIWTPENNVMWLERIATNGVFDVADRDTPTVPEPDCNYVDTEGLFWTEESGFAKPILFPLSYLDSMDGNRLKDQYSGLLYRGSNPQNKQETPRSILFLLRNHFNVFNLPESEYIDASKLPVNPYLKP